MINGHAQTEEEAGRQLALNVVHIKSCADVRHAQHIPSHNTCSLTRREDSREGEKFTAHTVCNEWWLQYRENFQNKPSVVKRGRKIDQEPKQHAVYKMCL